jgi:predicted phosphohydrolase
MIVRVLLAVVFIGLLALAGVAYDLLKPVAKQAVNTDFAGASELRFLVVGDQGVGNLRQWQVADAMEVVAEEKHTDAVFFLGDNFYSHGVASPEDLQWRYKFENIYTGALSATPFFVTLGNHDYYGNAMAQINYDREDQGSTRWQMPERDYVKTFGGDRWQGLVRVAFIDTGLYVRNPDDAARTLDRLLSQASPATWTLVVTHTPLISGNELAHKAGALEAWQPVLQKHRVDAILAGHDHNMQLIERGGWPTSVIVGVGGKSGQALEIDEVPGLMFFGTDTGFLEFNVTRSALDMRFTDIHNAALFEHQIQR